MTQTTSNNISCRQMARLLKRFHVTDGDIIAVKYQSSVAKEEVVKGIAAALERMNVNNALVIVVDNFEDLTVLNETEMRKHGWFRLKSISQMAKQAKKEAEQ